MEQLGAALQSLDQHLIRQVCTAENGRLYPAKTIAGCVEVNVPALLQAAAAVKDISSSIDQQQQQQQQQLDAGGAPVQLTHEELGDLICFLFSQELNPRSVKAWLVQQQKAAEQQDPAAADAPATPQPAPAEAAAAAGQADQAVPGATESAAAATEAAVEPLDVPVGGLPISGLDLSNQPLGLAGWHLLLRRMWRTGCVRRLRLSKCSIEAAGAGEPPCCIAATQCPAMHWHPAHSGASLCAASMVLAAAPVICLWWRSYAPPVHGWPASWHSAQAATTQSGSSHSLA